MFSKIEVREDYLNKRLNFVELEDESSRIFENLIQLLEDLKEQGMSLALYVSFKNEPNLLQFAPNIKKAFKLCLPNSVAKDQPLKFNLYDVKDPLNTKDCFGLPISCGKEIIPEIVTLPMVVFNRNGYRIGYGGGMFDRTFDAYPDLIKIGIAYAFQEVGEFETESHDEKLDYIVTEKEIIQCR